MIETYTTAALIEEIGRRRDQRNLPQTPGMLSAAQVEAWAEEGRRQQNANASPQGASRSATATERHLDGIEKSLTSAREASNRLANYLIHKRGLPPPTPANVVACGRSELEGEVHRLQETIMMLLEVHNRLHEQLDELATI